MGQGILPEEFSCEDPRLFNVSNNFTLLDYSLSDTATLIAGSLSFFLVLPFVLFNFKRFPIGSTSAILFGALLMVLTDVLTQDDVYDILGHKDNLGTIFLLLGMMLLTQYCEREELVNNILHLFLKPGVSFPSLLWKISLITFIVSALFTNDAACVILTPLILEFWSNQNRDRIELDTLLLMIATSANIGSVTTIFGNPQLALIASRTDTPHFSLSVLDLKRCIIYLGIPAVFAYFLNIGFLLLHYKVRLFLRFKRFPKEPRPSRNHERDEENLSLSQKENLQSEENKNTVKPLEEHSNDKNSHVVKDIPGEAHGNQLCGNTQQNFVGSQIVNSFGEHLHSFHISLTKGNSEQLKFSVDIQRHSVHSCNNFRLCGSKGLVCCASTHSTSSYFTEERLEDYVKKQLQHYEVEEFTPTGSIPFHIILVCLLLMVISMFFASSPKCKFDMGLVPMCAAIFAIVLDTVLNRRNGLVIMKHVDWSILMMFFGIFVWLDGFNRTRLPRYIWRHLGLAGKTISSLKDIAILATFVILGSNIFSNVPLTIIVLDQLEPCQDQLPLVLYLAWCATIAGNLTLFGSVANLIVAQKAKQTLDYDFTFMKYLWFGFPSTLVITVIGMLPIYLLLYLQLSI